MLLRQVSAGPHAVVVQLKAFLRLKRPKQSGAQAKLCCYAGSAKVTLGAASETSVQHCVHLLDDPRR